MGWQDAPNFRAPALKRAARGASFAQAAMAFQRLAITMKRDGHKSAGNPSPASRYLPSSDQPRQAAFMPFEMTRLSPAASSSLRTFLSHRPPKNERAGFDDPRPVNRTHGEFSAHLTVPSTATKASPSDQFGPEARGVLTVDQWGESLPGARGVAQTTGRLSGPVVAQS